jgi:hypothetical protein
MLQAAPAIRTRLKARYSETDEAVMLKHAMYAWRDTPIWIPVVYGRRCLGLVKGDPQRSRTLYQPYDFSSGTPYQSYDDAIFKLTSGKHWAQYWSKPAASQVIDSWYDLWGTGGNPQAGNWSGTAKTARQFIGPMTGSIWTGGSVSPSRKYLTRASQFGTETTIQTSLLYDRVLSYDACTMTAGSQSMTNTLGPTRFVSAGDPGLQIFVEADAIHSSTTGNMTVLTYVDQSGNAGHTVVTTPTLSLVVSIAAPTATLGARNIFQTPGNTVASGNPYLNLQSGDQGVTSITNYTFSAAPTGTNSFVLQMPLALFPDRLVAGQASDYEFVSGLEAVNKRIYDDAVLSWMIAARVTAQTGIYNGWMEFGWT